MIIELIAALLLGIVMVWLVLGPMLNRDAGSAQPLPSQPDDFAPVEETRRGQALLAIKEVDFDLATGKLSPADHAELRERFVAEAITVLRDEGEPEQLDPAEALVAVRLAALAPAPGAVTCRECGPRPEPDAIYCSSCGRRINSAR